MERMKTKKGKKPPIVGSATTEEWFEDVGLGDELAREEQTIERPPSKKKARSEVRYDYLSVL